MSPVVGGGACSRCGSDRFGYLCSTCQDIVCSCESCPNCNPRQPHAKGCRCDYCDDQRLEMDRDAALTDSKREMFGDDADYLDDDLGYK